MKKLLVALFAALLLFPLFAEASVPRPCLAKDSAWTSTEHIKRMEELGIKCATVYYNLLSDVNRRAPLSWVKAKYLDAGYDLILVLIIDDKQGEGLLRRIAQGRFDPDLNNLAAAISRADKQIVLRPLHEVDASWHPWGMYAKGNTPEEAIAALRHIHSLFDHAHSGVLFEVNFNRADGKGQVLGEAGRYMSALDKFVDQYSISSYNRCGTAPKYRPESGSNDSVSEYEQPFIAGFAPAYDRAAAFTKRPINVAETSTSGLCAPKLPWFEQMFLDLEAPEFDQVDTVTFFFGKRKPGTVASDVAIDWDIAPEDRASFAGTMRLYWPQRDRVDNILKEGVVLTSFDAPWSVFVTLSKSFAGEVPNQAINPVSGQPFGEDDFVLRGYVNQRILFPTAGSFKHGPGVQIGFVESPNDEKWWNNQISLTASYGLYAELQPGVQWGRKFAEVYLEHRIYTVPVPSRFDGRSETRAGIRVGVTFGGDWTKGYRR